MRSPPQRMFLGIEGGATHTVMLLTTPDLKIVRRIEASPGNIRLLTEEGLRRLLAAADIPADQLISVAIGLAGARGAEDRHRIERAAGTLWPGVPCHATHDLETALAAITLSNSRHVSVALHPRTPNAQVLVLSGTGSCCWGRSDSGHTMRVGGWGHVLGDRGSAYAIARQALQEVLAGYDRHGQAPPLGCRLLRKAGLPRLEDCINWIQQADKATVASLAVEVFAANRSGDPLARRVVRRAAEDLSEDACACVRRLAVNHGRVMFVLAGGTLLRQRAYLTAVSQRLRTRYPKCVIVRASHEGAWGAVHLARQLAQRDRAGRAPRPSPPSVGPSTPGTPVPLTGLAASPTEQSNPRSGSLDRMSLAGSIELFLSEEARIPPALRKERGSIERACRSIARTLESGGRLFYVGAGTSGRLGILDASECPPTFCTSPEQVQGILAGGPRALQEAVEGAEDDSAAGAQAMIDRGVTRRDIVVGIAASGRTPFVWGALNSARTLKAATVLVCFNPSLKRLRRQRPDVIVAPDLGPELLTGSTRLKAGSATKLLLNMFSTLAMVRLGKVSGNLMVDLNPSNAKLRDRAVRVVEASTGADADRARRALEACQWKVRAAIQRCRTGKVSG